MLHGMNHLMKSEGDWMVSNGYWKKGNTTALPQLTDGHLEMVRLEQSVQN